MSKELDTYVMAMLDRGEVPLRALLYLLKQKPNAKGRRLKRLKAMEEIIQRLEVWRLL